MDCTEIHLSNHIFPNVQAWIQIKRREGGLGEGAAPPTKQNDNTCLCSCVRWNMVLRDFVYIYIYLFISFFISLFIWYSRYTYLYIYIHKMRNMPAVSECKLNQVDS